MKVEDFTFIVGETKAKTHLESQLIAGFSFTVEKKHWKFSNKLRGQKSKTHYVKEFFNSTVK